VLLLAFPLAFLALLPVFLPVLSPVLLAFLPPLLPANQRRTTAPHMEGCPSWEFFPTIAQPALPTHLTKLPRNFPEQE
jgi:hypothetical protein